MDSGFLCYVLHWSFYCEGSVQQLIAELHDRDTMLRMEKYSSYTSHTHDKLRARQQFVILPYVFPSGKQSNELDTYFSLDIFPFRTRAFCLAAFFVYVSFRLRRKTVGAPSVTKINKQIFGRAFDVYIILRPGSLK